MFERLRLKIRIAVCQFIFGMDSVTEYIQTTARSEARDRLTALVTDIVCNTHVYYGEGHARELRQDIKNIFETELARAVNRDLKGQVAKAVKEHSISKLELHPNLVRDVVEEINRLQLISQKG